MDSVLTVLAALAGLLLIWVTFSITYTIFARFLGYSGFVWGVQFTEYSLLWMTLLGAAWVLKRKKHVSVDLITGLLSRRTNQYLDLAHGVMGMVVAGLFCWYGTVVSWGQYQRGVVDIQVVDISKYLILLIIPVGFFFVFIQFLRNFIQSLKDIRAGEGPASPDSKVGRAPEGGKS
jgi:TRAP-type C4-dicarboxylate transport system permease small subunit